ncbi:MAG: sulfatase-like hydrolase/transferase, partial [Planctomycetales bacterium]|nr:sulfatase-like hydrolase/transferase [Planctomycetales bacterium]
GVYYPGKATKLNVDGEIVPQKGYITDELTDYAIDWLDGRDKRKPFFLYLSHKGVHAEFAPAERHKNLYQDAKYDLPASAADTEENYRGKPRWVKDQRNSWHGVDYPYHSTLDVAEYYRRYCQTLAAVDDSVGRVMQWLDDNGLKKDTLVIYMGDNGFLFGEHGLIDKRNAYEESMRVPMLVHCPALVPAGETVEGVVANIDIGPTVLEAAGLATPETMDGRSFLGLAQGKVELKDWRDFLLYEYYWEYNFPHTPTMFALRGNQYKFISYHGVWDLDELYDLQSDPHEMKNLVLEPKLQQTVADMRRRLWQAMVDTGGDAIPLAPKRGHGASLRSATGSKPAGFPPEWVRD